MEETREESRERKIKAAMKKVHMVKDKMIANTRRAKEALNCDESLTEEERKEITATLEQLIRLMEKGKERFDATFRGKVEAAAKAVQEAKTIA